MTKIKLKGRELELVFNLDSWMELGDTGFSMAKMDELIGNDAAREHEGDVLRRIITIARILANQGEELKGKERGITDEELKKLLKPAQMLALKLAVIGEINKGMAMETKEKKEGEERDLVLEEINQKKTSAE